MLKTSDILDALDPQERQKLARELVEVIEQELEDLASDDKTRNFSIN